MCMWLCVFHGLWGTSNRLTNTLECFSCASGTANAFKTLWNIFFFLRTNMCVNGFVCNRVILYGGVCMCIKCRICMKLNRKMCMSNQCHYSVSALHVSLLPSRYVLRIYLALFHIMCIALYAGFRFLGVRLKFAT